MYICPKLSGGHFQADVTTFRSNKEQPRLFSRGIRVCVTYFHG